MDKLLLMVVVRVLVEEHLLVVVVRVVRVKVGVVRERLEVAMGIVRLEMALRERV